MTIVWNTQKRVSMLGALPADDTLMAKSILAAWNTIEGNNISPGYGLQPSDLDPNTWSDRDGFTLASFTTAWNLGTVTGSQGQDPLPAPSSKNFVIWSDLTTAHLDALKTWTVQKGVTVTPGQLPQPTWPGAAPPKPPLWPDALPWPPLRPDWYPATATWPPIGSSWGTPPLTKPDTWPGGLPFPPPLPGSSGYPYPPFAWPPALWPIPPTGINPAVIFPLVETCPAGQHLDPTTGQCQPNFPVPPVLCPEGQFWDGSACKPISPAGRTTPATSSKSTGGENTGILLAVGGLIVLGIVGAIFASSRGGARARANEPLENPMSKRCRAIISRTAAEEIRAGYPQDQAVAIGYSKARRAGCRIPARRRKRRR